jgi:hypothetical protein
MSTVASVDYIGRRIYLSALTMNTDLDTLDVYRDARALRRTTEAHRRHKPMIVQGGNVQKIAGVSATPSYVQVLYGCRIIPYNSSHKLRLIRDTFSDDGVAGRDCFDRSSLSTGVVVDIDVEVDKVEVRTVATSGNQYTLAEIAGAVTESVMGYTGP